MKKRFSLLLVLLALLSAACAEETFYSLKDDLYYHQYADCGGREGRMPLSEAAAQEFNKYLCPVCACQVSELSAKAVARGNTIVLRLPQSWLDDAQKTVSASFDAAFQAQYVEAEAYARLTELMQGERCTAFLADYAQNQRAEAAVRIPDIPWQSDELLMNQRHFGDVYYYVIRPDAAFEAQYTVDLRFFEHDLHFENGVLQEVGAGEWSDEGFAMSLSRVSGGNIVHSIDSDDLQLDIFYEMDCYIAVIEEHNADKNRISGVKLYIDGLDTGIRLNGYMDGQNAVYCCVLTDAEFARISGGAQLEIPRGDLTENASFEDTDYAIVKSGEYYGILDQDYQFVLDAKYLKIDRTAVENLFIAFSQNGESVLYDAKAQRVIASVKDEKALFSVENEAVFTLLTANRMQIYDVQTNALLCELPRTNGERLNGKFAGRVMGKPNRLVFQGEKMRLIDLQGASCSAEYAQILPLLWQGERGAFLIADSSELEYEIGMDGRKLDANWRCGVMDENGRILAEMAYVRAEILSETELRLTNSEGKSRVISIL